MPTPYEIGNAGEGYTVEYLKGKGCIVDKRGTHTLGLANLEAHSERGKILATVKSAITDEPSDLSPKEQRDVTSRAKIHGAVAWEAKVLLNTNLDLIGDIRWRKLN